MSRDASRIAMGGGGEWNLKVILVQVWTTYPGNTAKGGIKEER